MNGNGKAKDNSKWIAFAERHRNKNYSIVFNGLLDSVIADDDAPLFLRVLFWLIRHAWGNNSDSPIDFKTGVMKKQVDCASDLKLFVTLKDGKSVPNRQKVNPVFRDLEDLGYIRFEGQEIILIDDPAETSFAISSIEIDPYPTNPNKLPSFQSYIDEVWASSHPAEFTEYQKTERRYKELRTRILSEWNAFKEAKSDRGTTNAPESPIGGENGVGEGDDNVSDRESTTERPIIIGSKPFKTGASKPSSSSSFFPLVRAALRSHKTNDDDVQKQLIAACREKSADATDEEIAHFVIEKGKLITRRINNPAGFLLKAVPKCFEGEAFSAYREQQSRANTGSTEEAITPADELDCLLRFLEEFPKVENAAQLRKRVEELQAQKVSR